MHNQFTAQLRRLDNDQLVHRFNSEVGNPGWTTSRGKFLVALTDEFLDRDIDISSIYSNNSLSLKYKVVMIDKVVLPIYLN